MKKVVVQAKTIDDALELACKQLQVSRDQIQYHVLEQPSKGFLGLFGAREAKVEVELIVNPLEEAVHFLRQVLTKMKIEAEVEVDDHANLSKPVTLNLRGNDLGILIGKRGQTLESLQYLVNIAANKDAKKQVRFILDADGYRKRREESLVLLADRLAKQVLRTRQPVVLEPMPPSERKIIHGAIQKEKQLITHSEGIEPYRHVVISLKE